MSDEFNKWANQAIEQTAALSLRTEPPDPGTADAYFIGTDEYPCVLCGHGRRAHDAGAAPGWHGDVGGSGAR